MQQRTQDSRPPSPDAAGSSSPVTSRPGEPAPLSGMGSVALSLPTFPQIIEHARRASTRAIARQALLILRGQPLMTGTLNVSYLARRTGYHRRTVARALDFAVRVHVIERVDWAKLSQSSTTSRPGRPVRYKSLWKPTTSKRAPSPHTPLQRPMRTHASYAMAGHRSIAAGFGDEVELRQKRTVSEGKQDGDGSFVIADSVLREAVANFLNHVTCIQRTRWRMERRAHAANARRTRALSPPTIGSFPLRVLPRGVSSGRRETHDSDFPRTDDFELRSQPDAERTLATSCASRTSDLRRAVRSSSHSGLRPHTIGCG